MMTALGNVLSTGQIAQIRTWGDYSLPAPDPNDPQVAVLLEEFCTNDPHAVLALVERRQI